MKMIKALAFSFVLVFLIASASFLAIPVSGATEQENTWSTKAPMHQARSGLGAAVVDNMIYAIGGLMMSGYNPNSEGVDYRAKGWIVNTTEEYNPITDGWVLKAPMPTSRYNFAIASYQDKVYCFGGIINWFSGQITITNVTEVYDPKTDSWSTKTAMPSAVVGQASVLENKIYVIGSSSNQTTIQVYDPFSDSWSTKALLPKTSPYQVSSATGNKIYLVSYWQDLDNHVTSSTSAYDPKTDTWTSRQPITFNYKEKGVDWRGDWNSEAMGATSGVNAPMRLYVLFMQYVYSGPLPNLSYSLDNGSWNAVADEPTNRHSFAVVNLKDTLFLIGGYTMYYPAPDDSLFYVAPSAVTEQYIPVGYGSPDPAYLPPEAYTNPQISVMSPINQQYNESSVPLIVSVDKTVNWTSFSLDGYQNVTFSGNTNITDISNGLHNITVYAQDTFGNIGSSQTVIFTVVNSEPESLPIVPVTAITVVVVAAGLLVYTEKHRRRMNHE